MEQLTQLTEKLETVKSLLSFETKDAGILSPDLAYLLHQGFEMAHKSLHASTNIIN